jgi:hypothetical protein
VLTTHFSAKIKDLVVQVCTIVADNTLLAAWLVGEYGFEHYLVPRFPVASAVSDPCGFFKLFLRFPQSAHR